MDWLTWLKIPSQACVMRSLAKINIGSSMKVLDVCDKMHSLTFSLKIGWKYWLAKYVVLYKTCSKRGEWPPALYLRESLSRLLKWLILHFQTPTTARSRCCHQNRQPLLDRFLSFSYYPYPVISITMLLTEFVGKTSAIRRSS